MCECSQLADLDDVIVEISCYNFRLALMCALNHLMLYLQILFYIALLHHSHGIFFSIILVSNKIQNKAILVPANTENNGH